MTVDELSEYAKVEELSSGDITFRRGKYTVCECGEGEAYYQLFPANIVLEVCTECLDDITTEDFERYLSLILLQQ